MLVHFIKSKVRTGKEWIFKALQTSADTPHGVPDFIFHLDSLPKVVISGFMTVISQNLVWSRNENTKSVYGVKRKMKDSRSSAPDELKNICVCIFTNIMKITSHSNCVVMNLPLSASWRFRVRVTYLSLYLFCLVGLFLVCLLVYLGTACMNILLSSTDLG